MVGNRPHTPTPIEIIENSWNQLRKVFISRGHGHVQFLIGKGLISRAHRDLEISLEIGDAVANFMGVEVSRALPIQVTHS